MKTFYFLLFHIALALTEVIYYEYLSDIHNTGWECTGTCTSPNGNGVTGLSGGSYAVKTFDITDYQNLSITYQMNKGYCKHTCLVEYQYNTHNLVWTVIGFFGAYSTFKTKPILPTWPGQTTSISIKLNAPNSCAFTRIGLNGTKVTTAPTRNPPSIALALTEVIYYEYLSDIHNTGWECTGTCTSPNGNGVTGLSGGSYAVKTFDITDYQNLSITYQMNKGYCKHTCLVEYQYNTHNSVWTIIGFFSGYSTGIRSEPIVPT
eukprot:925519_1